MAEFLDYPGLEHFYKLLKAEIDSASLSDRFTLGYETQEVGSQSYTVVTVWDQGDVNVGETSALFVDYTQKMVALPEGREATANDAKGWADVTIRFVATSDFDIQFNQVIHATGGIKCETGNEYLLKILGHHVILRTLKDWMDAEPSPEPIDPTNGTLDIEGSLDLSEDFKVNGNVIVTGDITGSGTLYATGTITCNGTTSATVNAGATLDECDISIDNGTTTFNNDTTVGDVVSIIAAGDGITNAADCVVYCGMDIDCSTGHNTCGIQGNANFTIAKTATINISATYNCIYHTGNGLFTIDGSVVLTSTNSAIQHSGEIIVNGSVLINDCSYGIYNASVNRPPFTIAKGGVVNITGRMAAVYYASANSFIVEEGGALIAAKGISNSGSTFRIAGMLDCDTINTRGVFIIEKTAIVNCTAFSQGTSTSTTTIAGAVTISSTTYGIMNQNTSTVTITEEGTVKITIADDGVGILIEGGEIIVNGAIAIITEGTATGISNSGVLTGTGAITVNGNPYDF